MTKWFPKIQWWFTTVLVFAVMFMLLVDMATFFTGHEDDTTSNTLQRFFGGSSESWRSAFFGFVLGSLLVHFTRWGAIPDKDQTAIALTEKQLRIETLELERLRDRIAQQDAEIKELWST